MKLLVLAVGAVGCVALGRRLRSRQPPEDLVIVDYSDDPAGVAYSEDEFIARLRDYPPAANQLD